jgi:hypothetical protein
MMLGVDATHLTMAHALIQDDTKTVPAMTFLQGSQNGAGATPPDLKVLGVDFASQKFVDYGTHPAGGMYDRHLYSNYLGGNPGNQGRNFAGAQFIRNPYFGVNGNQDKYLLMHALTGKATEDVATPEVKPSSFLSIVAMHNPKVAPPPPPGMPANSPPGQNGSGGGQNSQPQPNDPPMPGDPPPAQNPPNPETPPSDPMTPSADAGGFSGGCSMSGTANVNGLFFVLFGLAVVGLVRRKRA